MTNAEVYGILSYLLQEIKEVKEKLSNLEKGNATPVTTTTILQSYSKH